MPTSSFDCYTAYLLKQP